MRRATAILAVLLLFLVGLCVLDRDDDELGGDGVDLCVALIAAVVAVEVMVLTHTALWPVSGVPCSIPAVSPYLPDPPPKSPSLG